MAWSKQTGRDITEVVQTFNEIGKNPVEAIKKLDGELNILTASQYANIQSLQEQGKTMDAAAMAAGLYAEAINSRAGEIERNLGTLESAWQSITGAAKKAWDAMLDVGRDQTIEDQIANTEKLIAQRKGGIIGFFAGDDDQTLRGLETRLKQLQTALANNAAKAAQDASNKATQDAGKKGIDLINSTYKSSLTQTQKLQKELTDLDKARKDAIAAGGFSAAEEEKYAKSRKNIEQEIADIKAREAKKNAPKNVNRGVAEAENTFARLYGQYDPAAQAARALTKEQGQLDLALSKGKITQEEYSKALAQASINYAAAIKGAKGLTQAEEYRAQLQKQLDNDRAQYSLEAAGVGMGDLQFERMQKRIQLEQQTNDRIKQLRTELANATTAKQREELQKEIDQENEFLPKRLAALQNGFAQYDAAIMNPINGWTAAVQNFGNQARDIAGQTQALFAGAFNGMTDSIYNFVTTGKLSMSDLAATFASGALRMLIQWGTAQVAMAALNAFTSTAAIPIVGPFAAPAAAASALGSAGSFMATINSVAGMAHDGIDSVPKTGTWLLEKGERVVTSKTSRKLDATLNAINSNERVSVAGGAGSVVSTQAGRSGASGIQQNIYIQNHSSAQVEQRRMPNGDLEFVIREATDRAVQEVAGQLASGYGDVVNAGEGAYGWKRPGD